MKTLRHHSINIVRGLSETLIMPRSTSLCDKSSKSMKGRRRNIMGENYEEFRRV